MPGSVGCGVSGKRRGRTLTTTPTAMSGFRLGDARPSSSDRHRCAVPTAHPEGPTRCPSSRPASRQPRPSRGAIPTPILAHTNGGEAMPVSAPDTAQTVDSSIAVRRPSAANDDAEHVDDTGWVRIVVALRAGRVEPTRAGRMVGKEYVRAMVAFLMDVDDAGCVVGGAAVGGAAVNDAGWRRRPREWQWGARQWGGGWGGWGVGDGSCFGRRRWGAAVELDGGE